MFSKLSLTLLVSCLCAPRAAAQVDATAAKAPATDATGNAVKTRPVSDADRAAPIKKPVPMLRTDATVSAKPQPAADASGNAVKVPPVSDADRAPIAKPLPMLRAGVTAGAKPVIAHAPPSGVADLVLSFGAKSLDATVEGPESTYLGMVLLSTSPAQRYYLVDLPPMLADAVVMGIGKAHD